MNLRQRLYDSNESENKLIKINNNSVLSKNLQEIRNRKPIYTKNTVTKRKKIKLQLNDYYIKNENKIFNKIIEEIRLKEVRPVLFTEQNQLINDSMKSRKKHYKLSSLALEKENAKFRQRLFNSKPFLAAKSLDKEYNNMRRKNSAKKQASQSLILPPINAHKIN